MNCRLPDVREPHHEKNLTASAMIYGHGECR